MAKANKPKKKATRPAKYEPPLSIEGTFSEVIRVAGGKADEVKKERENAKKKAE